MQKKTKTALIFLIPAFIYFSVFYFYPLLANIYYSLTKSFLLAASVEFTGLKNFSDVLHNQSFLNSISVTFRFILMTICIVIPLSLGFAVLFENSFVGAKFALGMLYIPYLTSMVIIGLIWSVILNSDLGVLNLVLRALNLGKQEWLNNPKQALPVISGILIWARVGYTTILFLAGLNAIPREYYESSDIDGANKAQKFIWITLPQLKQVFLFVFLTSFISLVQSFAPSLIITKGGPQESTNLIGYHIYRTAFTYFELNKASAMSVMISVLIFPIAIFILKKWGETVDA